MQLNRIDCLPLVQDLIPKFYFPQYQPIVDIKTGLIQGFESLIRCIDRSSNTANASWLFNEDLTYEWVQLEIDRFVRKQAFKRFALEKNAGDLFVNVSPNLLDKHHFFEKQSILEMLEKSKLSPERATIKITQAGDDIDFVKSLVKIYKKQNFKIAISDLDLEFNESNLEKLLTLEPDYFIVKLHEFRKLESTGRQNNALLALNLLRQNRKLELIFEGIETEEDFKLAIGFGASKMKGWLFASEASSLLKADTFKHKVDTLKNCYEKERSTKLDRYIALKKFRAGWLKIIVHNHIKNKTHQLKFDLLVKAGIVRYFLCNLHGKQVGPSINFRPNGYFVDATYINNNWQHRPYFAMGLSLSTMDKGQCLTSNTYTDITTRQSCITLSTLINQKTILFMDILVSDDSNEASPLNNRRPNISLASTR